MTPQICGLCASRTAAGSAEALGVAQDILLIPPSAAQVQTTTITESAGTLGPESLEIRSPADYITVNWAKGDHLLVIRAKFSLHKSQKIFIATVALRQSH